MVGKNFGQVFMEPTLTKVKHNEETNPLVTIGVPNYNYGQYISLALDSVLNQTYANLELIIVDDCSSDNSLTVIDNWVENYKGAIPITIIKNETNLGLTKVCNIIMNHANGKYFQTLDADDILLPDKIKSQVKCFEQHEQAALVYSNIMLINQQGELINDDYLKYIGFDENRMPQGKVLDELFAFNFIPYPLISTERAREVGGYDESVQVHDYYLWLKLAEKYEVIYEKGKTALYRIHTSSMSNSSSTNPESVENVLAIKFRYYETVAAPIKKIIRKNIYYSAAYLFEHQHPKAELWLKRNLQLNPGFKSFIYYVASRVKLPFSFFISLKKLFNKS